MRVPIFLFLMGVIGGATAALMLAPLRGVELRAQITQTATAEWGKAISEIRRSRKALEEPPEELLESREELEQATEDLDASRE